jgi:hypothetical protein
VAQFVDTLVWTETLWFGLGRLGAPYGRRDEDTIKSTAVFYGVSNLHPSFV